MSPNLGDILKAPLKLLFREGAREGATGAMEGPLSETVAINQVRRMMVSGMSAGTGDRC